ncbi:hypothetical protein D082_00990 [Synechocystis sp. PCC 6714]|nr:hypothetical protein D082_00990 [Synechocystis sp. PCC 6714]
MGKLLTLDWDGNQLEKIPAILTWSKGAKFAGVSEKIR